MKPAASRRRKIKRSVTVHDINTENILMLSLNRESTNKQPRIAFYKENVHSGTATNFSRVYKMSGVITICSSQIAKWRWPSSWQISTFHNSPASVDKVDLKGAERLLAQQNG